MSTRGCEGEPCAEGLFSQLRGSIMGDGGEWRNREGHYFLTRTRCPEQVPFPSFLEGLPFWP